MDRPALAGLVASATGVRQGIGSTSGAVTVDGEQVFVKVMPLSDVEQAAPGSTANLFGMPPWCQWGVQSAGFGVWRDLAAHELVSALVRDGVSTSFPLLLGSATIARQPQPVTVADEQRWVGEVDFHHGAPEVRERLAALHTASASKVFFLEHHEVTVLDWLRGAEPGARAVAMLADRLPLAVEAMHEAGVWHYDLHLNNVMTDGLDVFITDYGLATGPAFELDAAESRFVRETRDYDHAYLLSEVVKVLAGQHLGEADWQPRNAWVSEVARDPSLAPAGTVGDFIARHAAVSIVIFDFFAALYGGDLRTPFPTEALAKAATAAAWTPGDPWL